MQDHRNTSRVRFPLRKKSPSPRVPAAVSASVQVETPSCNTGSDATLNITPDWLEITLKTPDYEFEEDGELGKYVRASVAHYWVPLVGEREWLQLPRGMHGYRTQHQSGALRLLSGGGAGMGSHMILSGDALAQLESEGRFKHEGGFHNWLKLARSMGARFSRHDVAIDDRGGILDLDELEQAWPNGCKSSQFRSYYPDVRYDSQGNITGRTLYFGKGGSKASMRIYDKAREQRVEGHWIRVELQLRDKRAEVAVDHTIAAGGFSWLPGAVRYYLDFKTEDCRRNRNPQRVPTLPAWSVLLEGVKRAGLIIPCVVHTIEELEEWVDKQVGPSLATLLYAYGGDWSRLQGMIRRSVPRMTKRHWAMIETAGGVASLSKAPASKDEDFLARCAGLLRTVEQGLCAGVMPLGTG